MDHENDFWLRPVTDTVTLELVPGARPHLRINSNGRSIVQLELAEAQVLLEVLTVALGELYILRRDPSALARVRELLGEDITLVNGSGERRTVARASAGASPVGRDELVQHYRRGGRDFVGADLRLADLSRIDLRQVDLRGANLSGANLKRANLFQANLEKADLSQADLEETGLFHANLKGADLSQANLRRAYLAQADLTGALVTAAQLTHAVVLTGATLPDGTRHD